MPDITEYSRDPPAETIKVGGQDFEVRGLSARAFAGLARRYPVLVAMMNGDEIDQTNQAGTLAMLDMAAALVAQSIRTPDQEDSIADRLLFHEALLAVTTIMRLTTAPVPPGPFVPTGNGALVTAASATR